jgi:hypothetical protein
MALVVEDLLGLDKYNMVRPFVSLEEAAQQDSLVKRYQDTMAEEDQTDLASASPQQDFQQFLNK